MAINIKISLASSEQKILLAFFDVLFVLFFLFIGFQLFRFEYLHDTLFVLKNVSVVIFFLISLGSIFNMYYIYDAINFNNSLKNSFLTSIFVTISYLFIPFLSPSLPENRIQILFFYFAVFFGLLINRLLYIKFNSNNFFTKQILLICRQSELELLSNELESANPHTKITDFYFIDSQDENKPIGSISFIQLKHYLNQSPNFDIVISSSNECQLSIELNMLLLRFIEKGYSVRQYVNIYEDLSYRIPTHLLTLDFYKYFQTSRSNYNKLYLLFNRLFDITFSIIGLVLFLPIFVLILFFNLFWNKGKPFYTQSRVGKNSKVFKIFKLRTMVKNSESHGAVFAQKNDVRITPFGKLLRKIRLDEIPQLMNVLFNEMSIIGPRPERPEFVRKLVKITPVYDVRHMVKPGLTGWAQVNFSYGVSFDDSLIKLQYDLYYIKNRNIILDLNIVLKTLNTIIFMKGQ